MSTLHSTKMQESDSQDKQKEATHHSGFDDAAFEEAFKEVERSTYNPYEFQSGVPEGPYSKRSANAAEEADIKETQTMKYRIGSDRILDEYREDSGGHGESDEADELAKTAGNVLENVKGDQSTKFQESNFLSLMRQLRDREVKVNGDKIVKNVSLSFYI